MRIVRRQVVISLGCIAATLFTAAGLQAEETVMVEIEVQFTEGFTGQTVSIEVDGEQRASFSVRSSFASGLAHVEHLTLPQGKEVTVRIGGDPPDTVSFKADTDTPFAVIHCDGGIPELALTGTRPGYL